MLSDASCVGQECRGHGVPVGLLDVETIQLTGISMFITSM
jgi:hypothetical protein